MLSSVLLVNTFFSRLRWGFLVFCFGSDQIQIFRSFFIILVWIPKSISFGRSVSLVVVVPPNSQNKNGFPLQNLLPGTHLFCVYGDNWFQSVRYSQPYRHTWTFSLSQVHSPVPGGGPPGHRLRHNDQDHRGEIGKQEKGAWSFPGFAEGQKCHAKVLDFFTRLDR